MNALEWRAVLGLGALYALRMVGMFMILPVFALYARDLPGGAEPWQVGFAIGVYGLTQAVLQIPLGMASDRIGRKPVILAGMSVFALGSLVAGLADGIGWIMVGRALQGAGAVSSAVAALLADVTRDSVRTTAMAILGAGMGLAFILALVLGPVVAGWIGVDGIFFMTAVLALASLPLVLFGVPTPEAPRASAGGLREALADPQLLRLDGGILLLHAAMTALFVVLPPTLVDVLGVPAGAHWQLYAPVLALSVLPVFPLIRWSERRGRLRGVFVGAVALLAFALGVAALGHARLPLLVAALLAFFVAFNFLEGSLPSMISRLAPRERRGAALGAYSTAQFLGPVLGGSTAGLALQLAGPAGAFGVAALFPLLWLAFAGRLRPPAGDQGAHSSAAANSAHSEAAVTTSTSTSPST